VVIAQQIGVNNDTSINEMFKKTELLNSEFTTQRILRLCNMVATHYPKNRVIVIIQGPKEDIEVEKTMPSAGLKKDDELDGLISSLRQAHIDGSNINDNTGAEPEASENNSIPPSDIESILQDRYLEREEQPLTSREQEILEHVACGETNKKIAYIVGISEQTVKCHVSSILRKLRANDRAHSVALAIRNGFI
jgi:DNA-binding NarL/FixJ family response regulator